MNKEIHIYKSTEIDNGLWQQIAEGYKECFNLDKDPSTLKNSFCKSITGYCLHAVKLNEAGELMGHNYFRPQPYILNGERIICALSGGTFVLPKYRKDIFIFNDLFIALAKESLKHGWRAELGVPNENSFTYAVKFIKQKYIGDLPYYILPIKIGNILHRSNNIFNNISKLGCWITAACSNILSKIINFSEDRVNLHIDDSPEYLSIRLSDSIYTVIRKKDFSCVYRLYNEDGIKAAYIMDYRQKGEKTSGALAFTTLSILKSENIDAILYVGTIHHPQFSLFKVPKKFIPHRLPLCVYPFDKDEQFFKECSNLKSINYSLIDFDVR